MRDKCPVHSDLRLTHASSSAILPSILELDVAVECSAWLGFEPGQKLLGLLVERVVFHDGR